jgi:hypothetical protein
MTALPLEQRIAAALSADDIRSAVLATLIAETETVIVAADAHANEARERAHDPALSPNLAAARATMEDAQFASGRLKTLLPRLQARLHLAVLTAQIGQQARDPRLTTAEWWKVKEDTERQRTEEAARLEREKAERRASMPVPAHLGLGRKMGARGSGPRGASEAVSRGAKVLRLARRPKIDREQSRVAPRDALNGGHRPGDRSTYEIGGREFESPGSNADRCSD